MQSSTWRWAELDSRKLQLLAEAEQSLGTDYLLAFEPGAGPGGTSGDPVKGIRAAQISESVLECLNGLEAQLGSVVVAYRKSDA